MNKKTTSFFVIASVVFLSLSFPLNSYSQISNAHETENRLKKAANKYFEEENFVEAYPLYSQLLSLYPHDPNYNYRFGTCMLFTKADKEKAIEYLDFAVKSPDVENEAYYYLGRALHLNYRFSQAIRTYRRFEELASSSEIKRLPVKHLIEMCSNGKDLLASLHSLDVLRKKELNLSDYYVAYDLHATGGSLLTEPEGFKTKLDLDKKGTNIIYLPSGKREVFYSSYGSGEKNGKDIYVVRRKPDGTWGAPENLGNVINTPYDEDYPYYDAPRHTLYFSSKGHNSMGGYDIFKSNYNEDTKTWSEPVNLDFPINTPDDDILFIPDSLQQTAFFSSTRSSPQGSIDVYKIVLHSHPPDVVAIKGTSYQDDGKTPSSCRITVKDAKTNNVVGVYNSSKQGGDYSLSLANGGKFIFTIEASNQKTQSQSVVLPFETDFTAIKQDIKFDPVSGNLQINEYTNGVPKDSDFQIAFNYIKSQAQMDVNPDTGKIIKSLAETVARINTSYTSSSPHNPSGNNNTGNETAPDAQAGKLLEESQQLNEEASKAIDFAADKMEESGEMKQQANQILSDSHQLPPDSQEQKDSVAKANTLLSQSTASSEKGIEAYRLAADLKNNAAAKKAESDNLLKSTQSAEPTTNGVSSTTPQQLFTASDLIRSQAAQTKEDSFEIVGDNANLTGQVNGLQQQSQDYIQQAQNSKDSQEKIALLQQAKDLDQSKQEKENEIIENKQQLNAIHNTIQLLTISAQKADSISNSRQSLSGSGTNNVQSNDIASNTELKKEIDDYSESIGNSSGTNDNNSATNSLSNSNPGGASSASTDNAGRTNTGHLYGRNHKKNHRQKTNTTGSLTASANQPNAAGADNSSAGNSENSSNINTNNTLPSGNNNASNSSANNLTNQVTGNSNKGNNSFSNNSGGSSSGVAGNSNQSDGNAEGNQNNQIAQSFNNITGNGTANSNTNSGNSFSAQSNNNSGNLQNSPSISNTSNAGGVNNVSNNVSATGNGIPNSGNTTSSSSSNTLNSNLNSQITTTDNSTINSNSSGSITSGNNVNGINTNSNSNPGNTSSVQQNNGSSNNQNPQNGITSVNNSSNNTSENTGNSNLNNGNSGSSNLSLAANSGNIQNGSSGTNSGAINNNQVQTNSNSGVNGINSNSNIQNGINSNTNNSGNLNNQIAKQNSNGTSNANINSGNSNISTDYNGGNNSNGNSINSSPGNNNGNINSGNNNAAISNANSNNNPNANTNQLSGNNVDNNNSNNFNEANNPSRANNNSVNQASYNNQISSSNNQGGNVNNPVANSSTTGVVTNSTKTPGTSSKLNRNKNQNNKNGSNSAGNNNTANQQNPTSVNSATNNNTGVNNNGISGNNSGTPLGGTSASNSLVDDDSAASAHKVDSLNNTVFKKIQSTNDALLESLAEAAHLPKVSQSHPKKNAKGQNPISISLSTLQYTDSSAYKATIKAAKYYAAANSLVDFAEKTRSKAQDEKDASRAGILYEKADSLDQLIFQLNLKGDENLTEANLRQYYTNLDNIENIDITPQKNQLYRINAAKRLLKDAVNSFKKSVSERQEANQSTLLSKKHQFIISSKSELANAIMRQQRAEYLYYQTDSTQTAESLNNSKKSAVQKSDYTFEDFITTKAHNKKKFRNKESGKSPTNANESSDLTGTNSIGTNNSETSGTANSNSSEFVNSNSPSNNNSIEPSNSTPVNNGNRNSSNVNQINVPTNSLNSSNSPNGSFSNNSLRNGNANNTGTTNVNSSQPANETTENGTLSNPPANSSVSINGTTNNITSSTNPTNSFSTLSENSEAFELVSNSPYSASNPIPIDPPLPMGLIFKVQVGAFRKPIPQDLFQGFQPIIGLTAPQGFIRYSAGLFRAYDPAKIALGKIKSLGYPDAFIIAFYNGKRITIQEALGMLGIPAGTSIASTASNSVSSDSVNSNNSGNTSVSQGKKKRHKRRANESLTDVGNVNNNVNQNAQDEANASKIKKSSVIDESRKALKAIKDTVPPSAQPLTNVKGLVFTVQVGTFPKRKDFTKLRKIKKLYSTTDEKGAIRYSAGIYNSIAEAKAAKDIIVANTYAKDAFIAAYNNGERISLTEATKLLNKGSQPNINNAGEGSTQATAQPNKTQNASPNNRKGNNTVTDNTIVTNSGIAASDETNADEDNSSGNKKELYYTVQVGAFAGDIPVDTANKILMEASLGVETHKEKHGITSYTVGQFPDYKSAGVLQQKLFSDGFHQAFIVAYKNGRKISLQEAQSINNK